MAVKANATIDLNALKVAGANATGYITDIDSNNGITIKALNGNTTTGNYIKLNTNGLEIFKDGTSKALYGEGVRIGIEGEASIILNQDSISGLGMGGVNYFNFASSSVELDTQITLRDERSPFPKSSSPFTFNCDDIVTDYDIIVSPSFTVEGKKASGVSYFTPGTSKTITKSFTAGFSREYTVTIVYNATQQQITVYSNNISTYSGTGGCKVVYYKHLSAPVFSLGANEVTGGYALAEGFQTTASGNFSHAEGEYTTASGTVSHAEGFNTTASGTDSHAEGFYATASGVYSHAEGVYTVAGGNSSHAQGIRTTANGYCETVIGRFNTLSNTTAQNSYNTTNSPYILVAGKGTSESARSNALTLDWSGNMVLAGSLSIANSGTTSALTIASSSSTTQGISFSGFNSAPHVIATLVDVTNTSGTAQDAHQLIVQVRSISKTGATLHIRNNGTADRKAKVSWIAIG